jgi:mannose-1-phosphate guanylyltransferase/phosphomannomutase
MYGYVTSDYWCDIGDLHAYLQAHYDIFEDKITLKTDYSELNKGVWVGSGTIIESGAKINPPCIIGNNCRIGKGAVIEDMSIVGDNNVIEEEVSIKRSVLWITIILNAVPR